MSALFLFKLNATSEIILSRGRAVNFLLGFVVGVALGSLVVLVHVLIKRARGA